MERIFISREDLDPHLKQQEVVWTRGGKLNFQGLRVGHLSSGERDGITLDRHAPTLDGRLTIYDFTAHVRQQVEGIFRDAFAAVLAGGEDVAQI